LTSKKRQSGGGIHFNRRNHRPGNRELRGRLREIRLCQDNPYYAQLVKKERAEERAMHVRIRQAVAEGRQQETNRRSHGEDSGCSCEVAGGAGINEQEKCDLKEIAQTFADLPDQTDLTEEIARDDRPETQAIALLRVGISHHAFEIERALERLEKHLAECQADGRYKPDAKPKSTAVA
jgi:hypothetical protein